jgi:hypothetical protein
MSTATVVDIVFVRPEDVKLEDEVIYDSVAVEAMKSRFGRMRSYAENILRRLSEHEWTSERTVLVKRNKKTITFGGPT